MAPPWQTFAAAFRNAFAAVTAALEDSFPP
jgi:hypothetical protein